ncbi:type II toxin-antitoxin system RelE/ParE family toxin [Clavibacter michiganensis]|uniref:type II toxin-antitoxin system RelE/ParE family toxin n=1 Tax=Clavibacter michiganensis TaxID=28447 RepID=UPI000CE8B25F|nr:type II toxin-antitoxin system RelE/ParE family toxin [Clavibacter michiganensis]MDO4027014.1 type II toxin-antitoxin system RelE/ParE family toxin [Clavibacter michiganensis]MDO4036314.1 type II toxin-antitoxin system RelE/ParE family toxin [Clavibacter michiganensis]MDO4048525.1 type II toxin-antitoxin system RelE/ParE family toxin [Clavibacter michiganensis]MDO4074192.1 type II toxin-antitoxin system RelE/ParE family toxin [Clavibacter michiganensis]MDO4104896.1 type II toxin-antitoxin s
MTKPDETAPIKLEKWQDATNARGDAYVAQEGRKARMTNAATEKLTRAMSRQEKGSATPGEASSVRGIVDELRVRVDDRWYRLLFKRKGDKWVTLRLIVKKTNKLDNSDVELAKKRLAEHTWS